MAFLRGKMIHYQRYYHHLKKGESVLTGFVEAYHGSPRPTYKRGTPSLLFLLFLCLLSFTLIWTSPLYSSGPGNGDLPLCSSVSNGSICCDRITSHRTDICIMKGDVRTHSPSSSIFLYTPNNPKIRSLPPEEKIEKIRPYTRKWETSVMNSIEELNLVSTPSSPAANRCDVHHDVPAVFFSTGGYTGNVYHEFNDGLLPLYITSQQFNKRVVFVILEYHTWWFTKYADILSRLSDFPPIDFNSDKRVHCFPEAIFGLRIHDELAVNSALMPSNESINDFRSLLDRAYWPRIRGLIEEEKQSMELSRKPKLAILSRNGSRSITNEPLLVQMAERVGFQVQVLRPDWATELAKIYKALNSSDVMIGVHGAAMTHFLFMKPGGVFIQVVPLGTEWAAANYYGDPAVKLGLKYIGYKILPRESSLYGVYDKDDPVLRDPTSVADKGWQYVKEIYLDNQNVELDLKRFKKRLVRAYDYISRPR